MLQNHPWFSVINSNDDLFCRRSLNDQWIHFYLLHVVPNHCSSLLHPSPWMFSKCSTHLLTLTHLLSTLPAAHTKLWQSVMGGSDSGKQWSGQVITERANGGLMKHENLPSFPKASLKHTSTHWHVWTDWETKSETCKHVQHGHLSCCRPWNHRNGRSLMWTKDTQPS